MTSAATAEIILNILATIVLNQEKHSITLEKLMTQVSELQGKLEAVNTQLAKASTEIVSAVQTLRDELAAAQVLTPGAEQALTNLQTVAQALDDLNPDVPAQPAPEPAPAPTPETNPTEGPVV